MLENVKKKVEEINASKAMDLSSSQEVVIEKEISSLMKESTLVDEHEEICENENVVQFVEVQGEEEEISNAQKEEIEEMLRGIMWRDKRCG